MISGKHVYLRAPEREDLHRCHAWMNDPAVVATLQARYPIPLQDEISWIERVTRGGDPANRVFAICLRKGNRHIGNCGLHAIQWENRSATFGISIGDTGCWGRGFGTDATITLCRFGFEQMGLHKIRLDVYAFNPRARRLYERVGFQLEGVLRQELYRDGTYHDVIRMGLLSPELREFSTSETT